MDAMKKLQDAIGDYIFENGIEYDRLLVSEAFYNRLKKEAQQEDVPLDFPNLEVKSSAQYDFKLLP